MDMLKKLFPLSFGKVKAQDTNSLIVAVIVYVVAMLVSGLVMKLLGWIPLLGWLLGLCGWVLEIYCVTGLVLAVLKFLNKVK